MSKYIRKFESFKKNRYNSVNEELLGGIINFFKNMWGKAMEELKKLGPDPDAEEVSTWIADNPFNPADNNYLFKNVIEEFKKQPQANDQACLQLIDNILNPETGVLGKQGLQPLYDNLDKVYKDNLATSQMIRFCLEIVRNKAIKQYKYAGGPDLKVDKNASKIDPKKITLDLKDMNHLPDLKKLLTAATDDKKKRDVTLNWTEKTLLVQIDKIADEIKQEDVDAYLQSQGIEVPEGGGEGTLILDWGDVEVEIELPTEGGTDRYKITKSNSKKLVIPNGKTLFCDITGEAKKGEKVKFEKLTISGGGPLKIDGNEFYETGSLEKITLDGKEVESHKFSEAKSEGQEDLVKTLGDVKAKNPDAIKKISDVANLYKDPDANKDKIAEIEKQLGGGEEGK
jgi:hypothetical protein